MGKAGSDSNLEICAVHGSEPMESNSVVFLNDDFSIVDKACAGRFSKCKEAEVIIVEPLLNYSKCTN